MTELMNNLIPFRKFVPGLAGEALKHEELVQTSYRPTIVVGIGGTGLAVVRRLKQLLRRYYPSEKLDIFQFIVLDTAAQDVPEGEEPLDAGEFVHLGAFDAADMIRHLDENEYIARWWPGGKERPYRPTFSGTGSNRVRAVGRLVGYNYMGSVIIPRLEAKIRRAIEVNAQHGTGAKSLKFYIVCSLAGGTGSGMVLDLAYVVRMLGLRRQPTSYVTGILVTDDAFIPKARTTNTAATFSANTYAALKEINHFCITRTFHERYNDVVSTKRLPEGSFRPFDVAYLLGLHNIEGQALDSFESLTDMIAAEMMVEIASKLQGHTTNVLDNVHANENFIAGQPAAFSSFALSSLVYPLAGIASWCALIGHQEFSDKVLLTPAMPASEVEDDVVAFTQKAGVEEEIADRLIERLSLDDKGEQMAPPILSHDQVDGLSEAQLLGTLQRLEENAQAELAFTRETIKDNVSPIQKQYQRDLATAVEGHLRDTQRGPRYTAWFLATLRERLTRQRDEDIVGEQSLYRGEVDMRQASWHAARSDLSKALRMSRAIPWRTRKINNARNAYVTGFNAYLNAMVELERRVQAVLCLNDFIDVTRQLGRRANDLVNEWEKLSRVASKRADAEVSQEQATETEYSLMHNIVGRDELHRTYRRHFPEVDEPARREHMASQFWHFFAERVPNWKLAHRSPGDEAEDIPSVQAYYFLARWYSRQLLGKSLIERLQEIYGKEWQREIELRYNQTAPFWNYNLARFGDKIRNNLQDEPSLAGYGEDNVESWTNMVREATGDNVDGVNNKNPHEMLFLKTSHGLPLFALRAADQTLKDAYDYIKSAWDTAGPNSNPIPVHVSQAWEAVMGDIEPQATAPESDLEPSSNGGQPESEKTL